MAKSRKLVWRVSTIRSIIALRRKVVCLGGGCGYNGQISVLQSQLAGMTDDELVVLYDHLFLFFGTAF